MNVPPWHRPTPKPARSARPCLECLEDRITPTTHNLAAGTFPIVANNPNAHSNLTLEGTPWSAAVTLPNGQSSASLLAIGSRNAQPLASPMSPIASNSTSGGGVTPTLFQAWQSLFLDGASLEMQRLFYKFVDNIDEFPLGSTLPDAIAKAAASGIDFNAVMALNQSLARVTPQFPTTLIADIQFNLQYAGPLGLAVGVAGASAANQAVQIHSMPPPSSD